MASRSVHSSQFTVHGKTNRYWMLDKAEDGKMGKGGRWEVA
ncbi:MAG: hypothetical protein WCQ90_05095 [Deltaproteobacteria bacterium]